MSEPDSTVKSTQVGPDGSQFHLFSSWLLPGRCRRSQPAFLVHRRRQRYSNRSSSQSRCGPHPPAAGRDNGKWSTGWPTLHGPGQRHGRSWGQATSPPIVNGQGEEEVERRSRCGRPPFVRPEPHFVSHSPRFNSAFSFLAFFGLPVIWKV